MTALRELWRRAGLPPSAEAAQVSGKKYAELAALLASWLCGQRPAARLIALSGAQGSGKSTLAHALAEALNARHRRTAVMSLDDLYLTRAERVRLAESVHPLLVTRGVPGTHDLDLGRRAIARALHGPAPLALPRFDKGRDERARGLDDLAPSDFLGQPVDVLIVDGWCMHISPESDDALVIPINDLERTFDVDGRWRRWVNQQLRSEYQSWFALFDVCIALRPPSFAAVNAWRAEQEQAIVPERRMSQAELRRFIEHYERLTRHGIEVLPEIADLCFDLDDAHQLTAVTGRAARPTNAPTA